MIRTAGPATFSLQEERFEQLFHATYRDVLAFTLRRLSDRASADDVVSETFVVAWRRFEQVPADPSEALLWLYRVAQYGVLNAERGMRRRATLRDRLRTTVPVTALDGQRVVALDDEAESLARAFATLPEDDRTILLLSAWEGLRPAQIASVLGCSSGAAATRLSRARTRFEQAVSSGDEAAHIEDDR